MDNSYRDTFRRSIEDPEGFWGEVAEGIDWYAKWDRVLDDSNPPFYRWFKGGTLNTCFNALDRHVEAGNGDRTALIYDSPVTGTVRRYTFSELRDEVARFGGVLRSLGVEKGDRVVVYMPMIPEAAVAMLACARIGAVHSVVFGGFAPNELAIRIEDAKPKAVVTASCGIEKSKVIPYKPLLDKAIELSDHKPDKVVFLQREQHIADLIPDRDIDWQEAMSDAEAVKCVPVDANDPLYILYTSGTTGKPKGVVRDNGGHAAALNWTMKYFYGMEPGEVFWAASDVGWVVGHSYIIYAPLIYGCASVIYEGKPVGTPDPGAFWRVIRDYNVKVLFTAPTAFRAIKREDPTGEHLKRYDISSFRTLFLAGERTDPDTYHWAVDLLKVPVIDHWWQTETGWAIAGNFMGLELFDVKPGSVTMPVPGNNVKILDPSGKEVGPGEEGIIAVKLPLPPGNLITLWENDKGFRESYTDPFPGYYFTGDGGYVDEDGYVFVMGRVDDIINVAGHRLSTGEMEGVVAAHPDVAECAVLGVDDQLRGEVPLGFLVLKAGVERDSDEIVGEVVKAIRNDIGPIACFRKALVVDQLPKTRSGKILRRTLREIANGKDYKIPSTISDPAILEDIERNVGSIGYGKR